jgi:hypothetical protein
VVEDLDTKIDNDSALEAIRENIDISATGSLESCHQMKTHKPWFDEGCTELLDQRKKLICSGFKIQVK